MAVIIGQWLLTPRGMCLSLADLHDMLTKPSEDPEPPFEIQEKTERLCTPRGRPIKTDLGNHGGRNASPCTKRRKDRRKPSKKKCSNALYMKKSIEKPFLTIREMEIDAKDYLEQQAPSEKIVWTSIEDGDGPYTDDDE